MHYNTIVIGTGPGGEGAAMHLTKNGHKVAVIEKYKVGGSSIHQTTIPSKALRHVIQSQQDYNTLFNQQEDQQYSISYYLQLASKTINRQEDLRQSFYTKNKIDVYFGTASFLSSKEIVVANGKKTKLSADYFIIATGSSPYHPPEIDFTQPKILDSTTILDLASVPFSCTIYGGGVVACEYASILASIGVRINLVHQRNKLLSFLDEEIIHALTYSLQSKGITIFNNETYDLIEQKGDKIILKTESNKKIKGDILFWANGRTGNTQQLNLAKCSVKSDQRSMLTVNSSYQTEQEHIYAVGDVIGYPSLASASYDQGRIAANHILHQKTGDHFQIMPTGIYTTPEISSIGKTEEELTVEKIPYEVGKANFKSIARAQITSQTVGMLKIIFHTSSLEILGIHCFGDRASEIIHIGQAIMSQKNGGNNIMYFINTTFNYPTMAEAYRIAALNGVNRLIN